MNVSEIVLRNRSVFEQYIENYNNENFDIDRCNQGYKVDNKKMQQLRYIKGKNFLKRELIK